MKKMGTLVCLLALISVGGGLSVSKPPLKPRVSSPALTRMLAEGSALRLKGSYSKALDLFQAGYREAQYQKESELAARFLWGMANCDFSRRHYQEALQEYLSARESFQGLADLDSVSALNGSLASLYWQLGEFDAAIDSVKLALEQDRAIDLKGRRARLLLLLGGLLAQSGKIEESRRLFNEGIAQAARYDDLELVSNAWDRFGTELLLNDRPSEAEDALLEAFRIRKLNHLPSLASSYRKLGLLRLEQGDLRSASALLDASVNQSKSSAGRIPEWRFYHARGRLRLSQEKIAEAHRDFRIALELARNYRLMTPSADSTRVSLESSLQKIYDSFIETGAQLYFENGRPDLARDTFEALEENRASSLVQRLRERRQFRRNMPQAYWDGLAELQSAESAALLNDGEAPRQAMRRLRGSIIEMESRVGGAGFSVRPNLLPRLQKALDNDTVLLSFQLAEGSSQLWAATSSGLSLYQLPAGSNLKVAASRFREALLRRDAATRQLGRALYHSLFGQLDQQYENKSRWLLSLDEGLFELPLAALVAGGTPQAPIFLVELHSLQIVSSAANWLESAKHNRLEGAFVGIGDAVYNMADSRWRGASRPNMSWLESKLGWPWKPAASPRVTLGLNRLAGSGQEVEACASEWRGGSKVLKGRDVRKDMVRRFVEARPSVVHFATHVVRDPDRLTNAMIALSISGAGADELLGPAEIGGWNAESGVVVLSGCSSGAAVALPGAGLMGMTRAWLMAGAGAVIATKWPTPDDVGIFFRRFYRELQRADKYDPAGALRAAQIETLRSKDWRSQPVFWASYFAMGNY